MRIKPIASGTFVKKDDYVFRTKAELSWGNSNDLLGLLIMLNPGSSRILDENKWNNFLDENKNISYSEINGEILLDETMETVIDILEQSHPKLEGKLIIHNLFNLRDSESSDALTKYKEFFDFTNDRNLSQDLKPHIKDKYRKILHTELDEVYVEQFPWVWMAWTVNDGKILNLRRKSILSSIATDIRRFAIYSRQKCHEKSKELYTYHVCPRNPNDKKFYAQEMIKQMKCYWNGNKI